ncbi:hypothetical protein C8J57DRAFT_1257885 [Mycena rebaudengoi]|nr:hypothetical protein C8J57DRAFT_1257885 [Mycena rebaudengoi]
MPSILTATKPYEPPRILSVIGWMDVCSMMLPITPKARQRTKNTRSVKVFGNNCKFRHRGGRISGFRHAVSFPTRALWVFQFLPPNFLTRRDFFLASRAPNVLEPDGPLEYPLVKLVLFTEHKDTIRRGGVASTLKTPGPLCQDSTNVPVSPSVTATPGIDDLLLPLAGPEELDPEVHRQRPCGSLVHPSDLFTRRRSSFSATLWGRDYLRENGVYEIVRATHENEAVDKVFSGKRSMETCGSALSSPVHEEPRRACES